MSLFWILLENIVVKQSCPRPHIPICWLCLYAQCPTLSMPLALYLGLSFLERTQWWCVWHWHWRLGGWWLWCPYLITQEPGQCGPRHCHSAHYTGQTDKILINHQKYRMLRNKSIPWTTSLLSRGQETSDIKSKCLILSCWYFEISKIKYLVPSIKQSSTASPGHFN